MSEKPRRESEDTPKLAAVEDVSELFAALYDGAKKAARRRMGPELAGRDTPSDVAQSVVLELLQRADRIEYRGEAAAHALTGRVVRSKLSRRASRRRVTPETDRPGFEREDAAAEQPGPASAAEHRELTERLRACIENLSSLERDVLRLWMEGRRHPEIAAELGLSLANSYKVFARARASLQSRLAERHP